MSPPIAPPAFIQLLPQQPKLLFPDRRRIVETQRQEALATARIAAEAEARQIITDTVNACQKLPQTSQGVEQWRSLIASYFPASQIQNALNVMAWESGGDDTNVGDGHLTFYQNGELFGCSIGLMQIRSLPGRPSREWLLDPTNNVTYAAGMWANGGWCQWTGAHKIGLC